VTPRRMPARRVLRIAAAVACVTAAACSGGDERAQRTTTTSSSSTTSTTVPIPVAPLTGLPDPSGVSLTRAALSVKIENTPDARPQSGLDAADLVYEEVVEGGITRFWAVFSSNAPEVVGPVRSVRAMDPQIVTPIGGIAAYSGGAFHNVVAMRLAPVVSVDESNAGDAFYRESSRRAPHNLYARTPQLWQRGGQPVPPRAQLQYLDPDEPPEFAGEPVAAFTLRFEQGYDVTYLWNEGFGWLRLQHGEPFLSTSLQQIFVPNVVVQFVPYSGAGEGQLIGAGGVWVFSQGQVVRGFWSRTAIDQPTQLIDASGAPIELPPGRTWVELFPAGLGVDVVPAAPVTTAPTTTTTTRKR
jgi:hypothetical protein